MLIRFCASVMIALAGLVFGFYRCENLKSELSVSQQTEEFFRSSAGEAAIPQEERRLLSEFGSIIGASDAEGQQKSLSAFEKEAEQLAVMRRETYLKKGKLYRSVGLLFGLMGAILVI